jgi:hypothetical protein
MADSCLINHLAVQLLYDLINYITFNLINLIKLMV